MLAESPNGYREADLRSGREAAVLARALEVAARAARTEVSADDAWRATSAHAGEPDDWIRVAAASARALGLHPQVSRERLTRIGRERPALARVGPGQWWVVVGLEGRRFRVVQLDDRGETSMLVTPARLAAATEDVAWVYLQPLLALDPISASRRPHLGRHPWLRLRSFLALERRELWVVAIYAVVVGGLTLATPIAAQALVNTVALGSVLQPLVVLSLLLAGGLTFSAILTVLEAYVVEVLQRRVFIRVADDFGRRLPAVRTESLEGKHAPELVNRFFDVLTIQKTLAGLLLDGLALALQTAIGMVLLGFYHPLLLAFDVVLVLLLVVALAAGRGAVSTGQRESAAKYRTVAWLEDISRVLHLFRGATAQQHAAQHTDRLCRDYISARKRHYRILLRQITGGVALQVVAMVSLLGVGGWLVITRQLTLGQLVAAELVIAVIGTGFVKLGRNLEKLYDLNIGVLKIGQVVDLPVERRGGEPLADGGPARAALRNVDVRRGTRSVLSSASLELAPGQSVRLVGASGSGTSTVLEVLGGLLTPHGGSVIIDDLDLRRADLPSVRDRVALVQRAEFVADTIMENLRIAAPDRVTEAEVRSLLRLVDLEEVVDCLPQGLDTPMVPSGAPLSESQARRLSLVRALVARPRLLLLDRALDGLNLDISKKAGLLDEVLGAATPWTAVVVSDDPDVVERCARAVVITDATLEDVQ